MNSFFFKYLLLIIGGCVGVYQIAAVFGNFKGFWFFRNPKLTCFCGMAIVAATFGWFFSTTDLKRPHIEIEGSQQLWTFLIGSFLALALTMIISSLANRRGVERKGKVVIGEGLEDIKSRTVVQAFAYRFKHRKEGQN